MLGSQNPLILANWQAWLNYLSVNYSAVDLHHPWEFQSATIVGGFHTKYIYFDLIN